MAQNSRTAGHHDSDQRRVVKHEIPLNGQKLFICCFMFQFVNTPLGFHQLRFDVLEARPCARHRRGQIGYRCVGSLCGRFGI